MQDLVDKVKDFSGQALDKTKDMSSKAMDYLNANPTLAAMLLAGGGAGLLGGYLTSQQPEEEGESKSSRRMRILRNALLSAGAGAGAVGLGALGYNRLSEAIPKGTMSPVEEKLKNPWVRLAGSGAGALTLAPKGNAALKELFYSFGKRAPRGVGGLIGAGAGAGLGYFAPEALEGIKDILVG